jgi:hypothetical protein
MLAGLFMLHQCFALKASLPALLVRQLVGQSHISILWAVIVAVLRTATNGAGPVASIATSLAQSRVDVVRFDPEAAVSMTAVYSIAYGNVPFASPVLVLLMNFFGGVFEYGPERNLVKATFRRPLLLVLQRDGYEARKAVVTVIVARNFDELVGRDVV